MSFLPGLSRRDIGSSDALRSLRLAAIGAPSEADSLSIAHVDCDAFYATIEKRDDPTLADKPVIVGGGKRRWWLPHAMWRAPTEFVRDANVRGQTPLPGRHRSQTEHG
jgi:hypothetical protein